MELKNLYMILFFGITAIFILFSLAMPFILKYQQKKNQDNEKYNYKPGNLAFAEAAPSTNQMTGTYQYVKPVQFSAPEPSPEKFRRTNVTTTGAGRVTGEYSGGGSKTLNSSPRYQVVRTTVDYKPRY